MPGVAIGQGRWSTSLNKAIWHALPISLLVSGLIYYWFGVANRYVIFLYDHLGDGPFDSSTASRYWVAGLVADGIVLVGYTAFNWVVGRLVGVWYGLYRPPGWWLIWRCCLPLLTVAIPTITLTVNQPTLRPSDAAACLIATLIGLALALMPGQLAARQPGELGWLVLMGIGLMPALLLLRAVELPARGLLNGSTAYLLAMGGTLAGAIWSGVIGWLRLRRGRTRLLARQIFVAGLSLSYVLMPLVHHLWLTPPAYPYISNAANFFAFSPSVQLLCLGVAALIAAGVARLPEAGLSTKIELPGKGKV